MKNIEFNFYGLRDRSEKHKSALAVGGEDKVVRIGTEVLLDVIFKDERTSDGGVSETEHASIIGTIQGMLKANPGATFRLEIIPAEEGELVASQEGEPDRNEDENSEA